MYCDKIIHVPFSEFDKNVSFTYYEVIIKFALIKHIDSLCYKMIKFVIRCGASKHYIKFPEL